ncbi:MAG: sugar ABC transporter permease [Spirochaetaceae bacterium]|jgi:multiple sugar transport system permease protein|nr:sugar ABC transporter permease [Spirochaetaceae bacterium]
MSNKTKPAKIKGCESQLQKWGYVFVLPFVLVYCLFNLYPTLSTLYLAFTDLKGFKTNAEFTGLENFIRLIKDKYFWGAVKNTFIMWGLNFVPQLGIALILAIWFSDVQLKLKFKNPVRAIIYLPNLLTAASVAMLFRSLFYYPVGPVNQFLQSLGIYAHTVRDGEVIKEAFYFFRSVPASRGIVAFIQWWMWYGQTVILLMAGITSIPVSLYEAAVIDGANNRQVTWRITLPLLRPIMLYTLITSMIGGMQMLEVPFLLTDMRGAPDYSIRTTNVYLYNIAFQGANDYAYAACISIGLFIITCILALGINYLMRDRSELSKAR